MRSLVTPFNPSTTVNDMYLCFMYMIWCQYLIITFNWVSFTHTLLYCCCWLTCQFLSVAKPNQRLEGQTLKPSKTVRDPKGPKKTSWFVISMKISFKWDIDHPPLWLITSHWPGELKWEFLIVQSLRDIPQSVSNFNRRWTCSPPATLLSLQGFT